MLVFPKNAEKNASTIEKGLYAARNVFPLRPLFVTLFLFLRSYTNTIVNNLSTQQQTMAISVKNVHLFNRKRKNYNILQFLTTTKTGR